MCGGGLATRCEAGVTPHFTSSSQVSGHCHLKEGRRQRRTFTPFLFTHLSGSAFAMPVPLTDNFPTPPYTCTYHHFINPRRLTLPLEIQEALLVQEGAWFTQVDQRDMRASEVEVGACPFAFPGPHPLPATHGPSRRRQSSALAPQSSVQSHIPTRLTGTPDDARLRIPAPAPGTCAPAQSGMSPGAPTRTM